jgi:hypothetical protein
MRPVAFVVVSQKWHMQEHCLDLGNAVPWARLWIRQPAQAHGRSTEAGDHCRINGGPETCGFVVCLQTAWI